MKELLPNTGMSEESQNIAEFAAKLASSWSCPWHHEAHRLASQQCLSRGQRLGQLIAGSVIQILSAICNLITRR